MKKNELTPYQKSLILMKTKERYVAQYTACLLYVHATNYRKVEPVGMCACFFKACSYYRLAVSPRYHSISDIIPEWDKEIAYQVSPLEALTGCDYSSLTCGYWYPIWDKVSRVNYLNWLIDKYTKLSTEIN